MSFTEEFDNPYDQSQTAQNSQTLPMDQIIQMAIQNSLLATRVWLPAKVTEVFGSQKVSIQPLLQTRYTTGQTVNLPEIQQVTVQMPSGSDYYVKLPVQVGDIGIALFCDRSLDVWLASDGSIVDPQDSRMHDLADPVFIPGLAPFGNQINDSTTDLVVINGSAQLRVQKAGTFQVKNQAEELISNLVLLVQTLTTASTVAGGPFIPSVVTTLTEIAVALQTLEGS